MSIIEKLGLKPIKTLQRNPDKRLAFEEKTIYDRNLVACAPEMLEALISEWFFLEKFLGSNASLMNGFWYENMSVRQEEIKLTIEKATGKTWSEIKELLNE